MQNIYIYVCVYTIYIIYVFIYFVFKKCIEIMEEYCCFEFVLQVDENFRFQMTHVQNKTT